MTTPHYKPTYIKLEKVAPSTHDHNIVVKVLNNTVIVDKVAKDGTKVKQADVLVGDDTGCMYLNAHDGQCEKLVVGKIVALQRAKVKLINTHMRLVFDKWGSIQDTTMAIPGEVQTDPNFSDVVYQRVEG